MPEPLSAQERAKVFAIINKEDKALADRVALSLDDRDDPIVKLVQDVFTNQSQVARDTGKSFSESLNKIEAKLSQFMWIMLVMSVCSMGINAGLVGVSMTFNRTGLTVNTPVPQQQERKVRERPEPVLDSPDPSAPHPEP